MIHQYPFALLLLVLNVAIATAAPLEDKRDGGAQCAPGYWCTKKRDTDSSSCPADFYCNPSHKRNEVNNANCPNGYWCSKRSNVILDETDADSCPPGYWCSKRKRDAVACPPGYWCSKRSLEDAAETACPPGYWCSRDEVENSETANPCPSEILCKKESNVIHRETSKEDCPDTHWCRKRRQVDY